MSRALLRLYPVGIHESRAKLAKSPYKVDLWPIQNSLTATINRRDDGRGALQTLRRREAV